MDNKGINDMTDRELADAVNKGYDAAIKEAARRWAETLPKNPCVESQKPATLEDLLHYVCEKTNVNIDEVKSSSRKREIVTARQVFCWKARKEFKANYRRISILAGLKTHSDVIHSVRVIDNAIAVKDRIVMGLISTL